MSNEEQQLNARIDKISSLSRRNFLKGVAKTSVVTLVGGVAPAIISPQSLASSGELNLLTWPDYIWPDMIESFEQQTGIKVRLSTYGGNDEAFDKLKAANGKGFDLIFPSVTNGNNYYPLGLLQALNDNKLDMDNLEPTLLDSSVKLGGTFHGKRYLLPFAWGTEAITFDSSVRDYRYGELSYLDLWSADNLELATLRPKSALISLGLALDYNGELPSDRMLNAYRSEVQFRSILEKATEFAIRHKNNARTFWNNTSETLSAFQQSGCIIGQTWDGPGLTLNKLSKGRYRYMMPKEGGLAWMDSVGIPSGAANVEQAYAFINHLLKPRVGAMMANQSSYNSCVAGVEAYLLPEVREAYRAAYPKGALDNLWWWQQDTPYWVPVRQEYVDRFVAA
ncbi:MAG: extracellular solute-binding protein [Amphritea sp.]